MTTFERIKFLADKRHIAIKPLSVEVGLSENTIYAWQRTKPKGEDLAKVADYFHVSVDYLLGRDEIPFEDEDIVDMIEHSNQFDGHEITPEQKKAMIEIFKAYLRTDYGKASK